MLPYKRSDRVRKLLHKIISDILYEIEELQKELVTITDVELTDNLEEAKVFFSVLGNKNQIDDVGKILDLKTGFIKYRLGSEIRMRKVPSLKFIYDDTNLRAEKILKLLEKIKKE